MTVVAFVSYGNDSVALLQWLKEHGEDDVVALHSDTGWAAPWWADRVIEGERLAKELGYETARTVSVGMEALVRQRKGWPAQQFQFCTTVLKIEPAREWLDENDPQKELTLCAGIRRSESQHRANWPEYVVDLENDIYPGHDSWFPLVRHTDEMRNELIERAGFEVLPHRSQECCPCINADAADIRALTEERVAYIEALENSMGYTSKGNLRTIFRPKKKGGAVGIRAVWQWANSGGKYDAKQEFMFGLGSGSGCDSGMCSA